jgi:lipoprotein-anchoring transpeptidase ErfK/SrfK
VNPFARDRIKSIWTCGARFRGWRVCLALPIALGTLFLVSQSAQAQTAPDAIIALPYPLIDVRRGVAMEPQVAPGDINVVPRIPFAEPQVGPLIKRTYEDEVDRRTTAFMPENLDNFTSITLPDTDEHWVRVDLSEQLAVAYSGETPIRGFVISSGLPKTPTVTGTFRIRAKVRTQLMEGGEESENNYYYLPDVQWVQYFYDDFGFHGTYWHNDFGKPHSHGCINMTNADAKWLWDWLGPEWDGSEWQHVDSESPGSIVIVTE